MILKLKKATRQKGLGCAVVIGGEARLARPLTFVGLTSLLATGREIARMRLAQKGASIFKPMLTNALPRKLAVLLGGRQAQGSGVARLVAVSFLKAMSGQL